MEQRLASEPLDCEALEEKARFNSMTAARGVHELSQAYVIVASTIANSGMLCVGPAGCGKFVAPSLCFSATSKTSSNLNDLMHQ